MNTIYRLHEVNPFYRHAITEHQDLHHAFEDVQERIASSENAAEAPAAEVIGYVERLRDLLAKHFAQEEKGGYLEEATIRLPRLEPQAIALQKQHGEFLAAATRLVQAARDAASPAEAWTVLRRDYPPLMGRLKTHEAAENALLQAAFNEDMGL